MSETSIKTALARHGLRLTKPRRMVFETLQKGGAPLSIVELAARIPEVDRASIYRTVHSFVELGIAKSVAYGWKYRYELAEPFRPHHHHFICSRCQRTIEIQSHALERLIRAVSTEHHFTAESHTFEIHGLCDACYTPSSVMTQPTNASPTTSITA